MSVSDDDFLNVAETARRLGVHRNTVRNYVRDGVLPDARVAGSRVHRFRASDVNRLIAQRGTRTPSLQNERRAINPEFATANQLKQWPTARARDAQENFPQLVRRLLVETPGITNISIRAGDGVALEGYDGLADSAGTPFLPAGELAFELGVGEQPSVKATSDYDDRVCSTASPKTFVFLTPRRWAGKTKWAEERRSEGHFADVKVVDADDLEGWLQTAPGAHYWISEHLGLRPRDAVTLDTWWERFSGSTDPQLPRDLFLAGRQVHASRLVERLNNSSTLTVIQSEWLDDCLAFVHAALVIESKEDANLHGTAIAVSSQEAWDSILEKPGEAILIPLFEGADVGRPIDKGHHVIVVIDRSALSRRPVDLSLPRLSRPEAVSALSAIGVDYEEAQRLAVLGRRSMPALRRKISPNPKVSRPDWSQPPDARVLAPLMLVGSWTSEQDDIQILESVTNEPRPVIDELLERLSTLSDPPVRKVGNCWTFTSPEEAFLLLRESLSAEMLERIAQEATRVLWDRDPMLDIAPDERPMAQLRGIRRRYSSTLRRGLGQGLALLGAMGSDTVLDGGSTLADAAARSVRHLLGGANKDTTGRVWHQLAEVLPLLAEASPTVFLEAVEDDLSRTKPVLLGLFWEESGASPSFGSASPHPHLLWAIETLCWSSEYLIDAARILARLAFLDPGGKSANRPLSSLGSVLAGWVRHTSAPLDHRLLALDGAYRVSDDVGWRLTFELWPSPHRMLIPPAVPRFRDWRPTETSVPLIEWIAFVRGTVERAIDHAGSDPHRLGQLIEGIETVPPDDRERIIALISDRVGEIALDSDTRLVLWERLHALVTHHEVFADAAWAMPEGLRFRLSSLTAALEPTSDPQRFAYLFDWNPDLPGFNRTDFEAYQTELSRLRSEALQSVIGSPESISWLTQLARRTPAPTLLGWALAEYDEITLPHLLSWFSSTESALTQAAASWSRRKMLLRGPDWLAQALREPLLQGAARDLLIINAPAGREIWVTLSRSPDPTDEKTYWSTAHFDVVPLSDVGEALRQLIERQRAWTAVVVASHATSTAEREGDEASINRDLIVEVLDAALNQSPGKAELSNMTGFYLGELLNYLNGAERYESALLRYEFNFFQLLRSNREPIVLNRTLAGEPELFVDLVKRVYRGRDDPRRELSQDEQDKARHAWWILYEWKGFPGRTDDGLLDADVMSRWVRSARLALSDADRSDIGDEVIGQAFGHSPVGADGAWPAEPLRDLLEVVGSRELEHGIILGKMNSRGVTSRGVYDGGEQERDLANQYREWSQVTQAKWPRTARILRDLAGEYDREARRQDTEAELDADRD